MVAQLVREIFEENESKRLYGAMIWTRMLVTDSIQAANECETRFSDRRLRQFWDEHQILEQLLAQTLNLKARIAWDVYLIYPPDHPWNRALPPAPKFWMYQLDEEPTLLLDPPRLKDYVWTLLERTASQ
ncbi:MAG TPA: hypothetical protein VFR47_29640 [Anaerolineales bacterium]|nr:hypothetical protein [Anaerolineales bacterium]